MKNIRIVTTLFVAGLLMVSSQPAAAQLMDDWVAEQGYISRLDLEKLRNRLENTAVSPAYSPELRELARLQAASVLTRLREGDFQVGDRIFLNVENEPVLIDTFVVEPQRTLTLPIVGSVNLHGVLRAELDGYLREYLGRYLRRPNVKAESFIRVTVVGAVGKPGFYVVRSESPLSDALMQAGGPHSLAAIDRIRVERGSERILEGETLRQAIAHGRTWDQLSLRAGDQLFVPERGKGAAGVESAVRIVALVLSIPLSVFALTQIF